MTESLPLVLGAWATLNLLALAALAVLARPWRRGAGKLAREVGLRFDVCSADGQDRDAGLPESLETLLAEADRGDRAERPSFAVGGGRLPSSGRRAAGGGWK